MRNQSAGTVAGSSLCEVCVDASCLGGGVSVVASQTCLPPAVSSAQKARIVAGNHLTQNSGGRD